MVTTPQNRIKYKIDQERAMLCVSFWTCIAKTQQPTNNQSTTKNNKHKLRTIYHVVCGRRTSRDFSAQLLLFCLYAHESEPRERVAPLAKGFVPCTVFLPPVHVAGDQNDISSLDVLVVYHRVFNRWNKARQPVPPAVGARSEANAVSRCPRMLISCRPET